MVETLETDKMTRHQRDSLRNSRDIVLIVKHCKKIDLLDVTVPSDHNLQQDYLHKIEKYADLAAEVRNMWKMYVAKARPIVISSTGLVHTKLQQHLQDLDISYILPQTQKAAIFNACRMPSTFLSQQ